MKAQKPILHGSDHLPGHADPIPGLTIAEPAGGFVDQILAHPALVHYWRMGAASGNQPDVSGHPGGPVDLVLAPAGAAGTYDVAGALTPAEDDGAYETGAGGTSPTDTFATVIAHRANFAGTSSFTIECWVWINPSWTTGEGYMVSCGVSGGLVWAFGLTTFTPSYRLQLQRGTTGSFSTLGITAGEWHHLVATYDGTTSRIYLDGALWFNETNAATIPSVSQAVRVGQQDSIPDNYFWGKIDEVALYTDDLSAAEVEAHYEAGITPGGITGGPWSIVDAKGDVIAGVADNTADRLAVGSDGQVLTADSAETLGVKWATPATSSFDPATATTWWFPLADSDGTLVLDASGALIPTLTPL